MTKQQRNVLTLTPVRVVPGVVRTVLALPPRALRPDLGVRARVNRLSRLRRRRKVKVKVKERLEDHIPLWSIAAMATGSVAAAVLTSVTLTDTRSTLHDARRVSFAVPPARKLPFSLVLW